MSGYTQQGLKADGLRWQGIAQAYANRADRPAASFYTAQALKAQGLRWQAMARSYAKPQVVDGSSFDWGAAGIGAIGVFGAAALCSRADRRHSPHQAGEARRLELAGTHRRDMCQGQSLAHVVSGESSEDDAEERMAIRRLREGVRARDEPAVDEADERPEHHVLRKCECHRKPPLVDVDALPHHVEPDAEQRTVQRMHDEAHRAAPTAEELHVGVVATEDPPVERFLQSPDHRCDGAGSCGTKTRRHTLGACPKGTPFIAPLVACRCSLDNSSRSRHRIHARP